MMRYMMQGKRTLVCYPSIATRIRVRRRAVRTELLFVGCLTSQQHASVGTGLLRQLYVLPH